MKVYLICVLLSLASMVKAQVPVIISNTTEKDKTESGIYQAFNGKYDFVIAYTNPSFWRSNILQYKILALKNNSWSYISYDFYKKGKSWSKPRIKERPFNFHKAETLIELLEQNHFWLLSRDSLNIQERRNSDGSVSKFNMYDDTNHKFEIITTSNYVIIEAYAPEYFLEVLPEIKSRELFIKCRNIFLGAIRDR